MLTKHCEFIKEKYTLACYSVFLLVDPLSLSHTHMPSVDARKESEARFLTFPALKKNLHLVYRRRAILL